MYANKLDEYFIRKVNEIALQSVNNGFGPFGAILVKDGKTISTSDDQCIQYSDPTSHAELILISEFCRNNKIINLEEYTIYCNVEPCVMCSGAIHWSRIARVVFGVSQSNLQSVSKGKIKPNCRELINIGNKKIEIVGPVLQKEGLKILKKYNFQSKKDKHQEYQLNINNQQSSEVQ